MIKQSGIMKPPRSVIKKWHEIVADFGCVITGARQIQIHHCVGRSFKHGKVQIGEIFILPLWFMLHDVSSNHPFCVTHRRKAFVREYGKERDLFLNMVEKLKSRGVEIPFDQVYLDKIAEVDR